MRSKKAIPACVNLFNPWFFAEAGYELQSPDLIRLFCAPSGDLKPTTLLERYRRISSAAMEPAILPVLHREGRVSSRKCQGSIRGRQSAWHLALCGFVAEMIAPILYEMVSDDKDTANPTVDEFERLPQSERVKILHNLGAINQEASVAFSTIRKTRREYLHFISKRHSLADDGALKIYAQSITILVDLVGHEFENGAWVPKPSFARYLKKHGLL